MRLSLKVAARASLLSQVQYAEVLHALQIFHPDVGFIPLWIETQGDKDQKTSLRSLGKTDFFTKEIDQLQLNGGCRVAIHSAKDLPEPLAEGLVVAAITVGIDPSDSLVLQQGAQLETLPVGAAIGVSSERREAALRELRADLTFVEVRGGIPERIAQVDRDLIQGVVVASAALVRLGLEGRRTLRLPGATAPLQGQLAVVVRAEDREMLQLFACLDVRR